MNVYTLDIKGFKAELPIMPLPSGISIAFFNLHGDSELTEHCAKELAKEPTPVNVQKTEEKQMEFFDITAISFAKTKLEEVLNVKTDIKFPKPGKVKKLKGTFDKTMGIKGELYEVKQLFEVKNDYGVWEKYNYRSIVEFHSARGYRVLLIQVDGVQIFPPLE